MIDLKIIQLFYTRLGLENVNKERQDKFITAMKNYLMYNRDNSLKGRNYEYIERKFVKLQRFLIAIGYNEQEIIDIITKLPSLLNSIDELYCKYLLLGIIENENNTLRRDNLLLRTKDFITGYKTVYARYKLICETGYDKLNWHKLMHCSTKDFATIFLKGNNYRPYEIFENIEQVNAWLEQVDVNEFDLEAAKAWPVNEEIVRKYEQRTKEY